MLQKFGENELDSTYSDFVKPLKHGNFDLFIDRINLKYADIPNANCVVRTPNAGISIDPKFNFAPVLLYGLIAAGPSAKKLKTELYKIYGDIKTNMHHEMYIQLINFEFVIRDYAIRQKYIEPGSYETLNNIIPLLSEISIEMKAELNMLRKILDKVKHPNPKKYKIDDSVLVQFEKSIIAFNSKFQYF